MKVLKNFSELAKHFNKTYIEIVEADKIWSNCRCIYIDKDFVIKEYTGNEIVFVSYDEEDNNDCKKYIMTYEIKKFNWKVYVDDVEGWQECEVIDIQNTGRDINRATVICKSGTQLNRLVEYALDDDEIEPNGCIYMIEIIED